jgi:single-strand DNA-binding protein
MRSSNATALGWRIDLAGARPLGGCGDRRGRTPNNLKGGVVNQVTLTGRLTRDPELRSTPNGTQVCKLRLAVDGMGTGGRDDAGYVNVTQFGPGGEAAAEVLTKGWLVAVEGRLEHQTWERDGVKREAHGIIGKVEFLAAPRDTDRDRELGSEQDRETAVDPHSPGSASRTPTPGLPGAATRAGEQVGAGVGIADDDIAF